jgi:hypothetical protein
MSHLLPAIKTVDWERVAFDVARNQLGPRLPIDDLIPTLGISTTDFEELCDDALFKRKVKEYTKELTENGTSFALKAQLQAEDLLATQYKIAKHPDTPPSVAVAAIANTVRWAGFDKKAGGNDGEAVGAGGPRISININLAAAGTRTTPSPSPSVTVDGTTGALLPDGD